MNIWGVSIIYFSLFDISAFGILKHVFSINISVGPTPVSRISVSYIHIFSFLVNSA